MAKEYIERETALQAIYTSTAPTLEVKAIPAADVVERPSWIPVEERLPDKSGNYLTAFEDGTAMAVNEFMHPRDWLTEEGHKANPNGKWYWGGVTHWMPLPEPPKEDNLKGDKSMIIIRTNLEELPTTCCDCPLKTYDPQIVWKDSLMTQWGGWVCPISGQLINNTKREEFCPLEEIPEPPKGETK